MKVWRSCCLKLLSCCQAVMLSCCHAVILSRSQLGPVANFLLKCTYYQPHLDKYTDLVINSRLKHMKSYRTEPFQNIGLLVYVFDDQELCTMYFCTFNGTFIVTCKMYHLRYDSYVRWPWIRMGTNIFRGHQMFGYVYHIWITFDISYMIYMNIMI